ncbi:MAG: 1-acyl-sn-glycerol-3-phosphate acyltransferase [Fibromonadaceae bacterium]|jgi:1-acyl-sn-glycerol-3-phosphate acyltransferase|nr:1-acyl-sn-glycerol-3-phosphate acyltransferase [Fibromonadaceae bacterium]
MAKIRATFLGILFYLFVGIGLLFVIPPWLLYCAISGQRHKFVLVCKPFFAVVFFLFGVKVKLEGDLPEQGKACFMLSNHQSFIDVPALMHKIFPCAFLAKKSLFKVPYFGPLLFYTGSIPVERGNRQANADLPKKIQRRLSQNFPVMAFPEGTRSENGELLPFKSGVFRIIKEANVPIFPITIIGAHKVLPKTGLAFYPGEIRIIPHKIITVQEIESMTYEQLKKNVAKCIGEPFKVTLSPILGV